MEQAANTWLAKPVKAVLLDITGVLYESGTGCAIPGSIDAIKRLRSAGIPFRLVTNETQNPLTNLVEKLNRFGYDFRASEIIAPGPTVSSYLKRHGLRPYLLVHSRLLPEFADISTTDPNCVVVGDAAQYFTFDAVNRAFQLLLQLKERYAAAESEQQQQQQQNDEQIARQSMLISMGKNKYYKENGSLTIDLGAYTVALEYATDLKAIIIGKPSADYFRLALKSFDDNDDDHDRDRHLTPEDVVMIGDDIIGDVKGSQDCGMRGVLVRTGKFRPSNQHHPHVTKNAIVADLREAIEMIIAAKNSIK